VIKYDLSIDGSAPSPSERGWVRLKDDDSPISVPLKEVFYLP
jgi:hypothetical protein